MAFNYDAIIIGTGQAGPSLAGRLTQAGMKIAVVERKHFGGTCVNTACIPTKTLVASAEVAHKARRAADFGVEVSPEMRVDMKRVKARKDAVSAESRVGIERYLKGMSGCTVYEGHARFESPREVRVGKVLLSAERIFINTGGTRARSRHAGTRPGRISHQLIDDGCGFPAPSPRHRGRQLVTEGVTVRLGAECMSVAKDKRGIKVKVSCADEDSEVIASHLLLAIGRRPNTDDLGLDKVRRDTDKHGFIIVDEQLRTSAPGIWALGDCNGKGAFTHTSCNDFEIVAANVLDGDRRSVADRIPAYPLYIDPPLGRAGLTEAEVRARGLPALIGRRPITRVSRAVEKGETQGFMKIIVSAETTRILGAAILGTGGDEVIHGILDVMYAGVPSMVLQKAMHIHPTVSELIPTMLGELQPLVPS
jgi:pyruvate/2-oxoglutarate dehydrogenase complex dihydrolipoamide dehydrogenase (E3) component